MSARESSPSPLANARSVGEGEGRTGRCQGEGRTVYIAGPMTGIPDWNRAAFARAAERLSRDGWTVYDPVEIGEMYGEQDELAADPELLALVIRAELGYVARSDAIYLLAGWEYSAGARRELQVALACGIDVILECREGVAC